MRHRHTRRFLAKFRVGLRNYPTNWHLDKILREFLDDSDIELVSDDGYHRILRSGEITIRFWSANKYFAFAHQGEIYRGNHLIHHWNGQMPATDTLLRLDHVSLVLPDDVLVAIHDGKASRKLRQEVSEILRRSR